MLNTAEIFGRRRRWERGGEGAEFKLLGFSRLND
jgi:hypothetical protein